MGQQGGSSSPIGTKARFLPSVSGEVLIPAQPAQGGNSSGKNNHVFRPGNAAPFVRTPMRMKGFGPIHVCLVGGDYPIGAKTRRVQWPVQVWRLVGWWFGGEMLRDPREFISSENRENNPQLVLARSPREDLRATHNMPICQGGGVLFPTRTFGK